MYMYFQFGRTHVFGPFFFACLPVGQVRCMLITKKDFRSCMNEKKFQDVLEEVAYQRAEYREQRVQQQHQGEKVQVRQLTVVCAVYFIV